MNDGTKEKKVLLVGATGLIGGQCLKFIKQGNLYGHVHTITRSALPKNLADPDIIEHVVDFDGTDPFSSMPQVDHVIIAFGTTIKKAGSKDRFYEVDFKYPYEIAKKAFEKGADHILMVSSIGADAGSMFFYNRVKGELEDAIIAIGYNKVSIFRPSLLLGDRNESRFGEEFGQFLSKSFMFAIPGQYKPVEAKAVAAAMLTCAEENKSGIHILESSEIRKMNKGTPKK